MAKKSGTRKPRGAAGIEVVDGEADDSLNGLVQHADENHDGSQSNAPKPGRKGKQKSDAASTDQITISDIRKAAAFVNSIGGLDKAIALLQILKVAKEVQ